MVDRLRLLLNRPLTDAARPRLFAIAAALIAAVVVGLSALDDAGLAPVGDAATGAPTAPVDGATDIAAAASPSPAPTAAPPSEEGTPAAGALGSRADVAAAKRAARRVLAGYLPYTYGRGDVGHIRAATAVLRRRLARERPRVPTTERRRHARLILLHSDGVGPDDGRLVAVVADGRRRYSVTLELAAANGRWRVAGVGG